MPRPWHLVIFFAVLKRGGEMNQKKSKKDSMI